MKKNIKLLSLLIIMLLLMPIASLQSQASDSYGVLASVGYDKEFLNNLSGDILKRLADEVGGSEVYSVTPKSDLIFATGNGSGTVTMKSAIAMTSNGTVVCVYWEGSDKMLFPISEDTVRVYLGKSTTDSFEYKDGSFYAETYKRKDTVDNWKVTETYDEKYLSGLGQGGSDLIAVAAVGRASLQFSPSGINCYQGGAMVFTLTQGSIGDGFETSYYSEIDYIRESIPYVVIAVSIIVLFFKKKKKKTQG